MKKLLFAFMAVIISLVSCKEIPQEVILDPSQLALVDTTYVSSSAVTSVPNNVLMEEFSGVKCASCPAGNSKTHDIYATNPQRITIVTVHSDFLASPYTGEEDLRCDDANTLVNTLGPIGGKPSTFINRKKLEDPNKIVISGAGSAKLNAWETYVNDELAIMTPISLDLETIIVDVAERKFRYRVTLMFAEDMTNINLGFMLTESGMKTTQKDGITDIQNYEHEWVLRDFITSVLGEPLTETLSANTVIIKEFEIDLDDADYNPSANWQIDNMELVAFVVGDNQEVLQSAKVHL